ncbi:kxDL motif-containing protein CG10681 [Ischnura elegans]|uniref:kxDL motif-containing protein CG10681 n=1 Tax=Ischnura elegans TaxID=197161 RepID=UPI001ED892E4|nr:kxDL motif-containing protein CG10681 [Ischnura elegans]
MAESTPESDLGSIECFQNYTAPEVFIQGLAGIVNQQDVEAMIRAQKQMLQRFEKTNEMLINCNALSVNRLKTAGSEFKKHTALLLEMKKDLDHIFKRIRILKTKLAAQYPQGFAAASTSAALKEDSDAEEVAAATRDEKCKESASMSDKDTKSLQSDDLKQTDEELDGDDDREDGGGDEEGDNCVRRRQKRSSSSTESANGTSANDTSPCTSDTG